MRHVGQGRSALGQRLGSRRINRVDVVSVPQAAGRHDHTECRSAIECEVKVSDEHSPKHLLGQLLHLDDPSRGLHSGDHRIHRAKPALAELKKRCIVVRMTHHHAAQQIDAPQHTGQALG